MIAVGFRRTGVAVAVRVAVLVPGQYIGRGVFVDLIVTVVVDIVAVLCCAGVGGGLAVIAVVVVGDVSGRLVAVGVG